MRNANRVGAAGILWLVACGPSTGTDAGEDAGGDGAGNDDDGTASVDANANAADAPLSQQCGELTAVVRDFRADHPDFESGFEGSMQGLVQRDLGSDDIPVYAPAGPTSVTSGRAAFDEWYRDVAGVNMRFEVPIPLAEITAGVFVYENPEFFPIDGMGFPGTETLGHNYHFTTEIRGTFKYRGGELFTFSGDDDVFVFVNRKLALDLGGIHAAETATIDFDAEATALGLTQNGVYRLDVFHAERHVTQSSFRIETSIDCIIIN